MDNIQSRVDNWRKKTEEKRIKMKNLVNKKLK